jgi:hypothetical protein
MYGWPGPADYVPYADSQLAAGQAARNCRLWPSLPVLGWQAELGDQRGQLGLGMPLGQFTDLLLIAGRSRRKRYRHTPPAAAGAGLRGQ